MDKFRKIITGGIIVLIICVGGVINFSVTYARQVRDITITEIFKSIRVIVQNEADFKVDISKQIEGLALKMYKLLKQKGNENLSKESIILFGSQFNQLKGKQMREYLRSFADVAKDSPMALLNMAKITIFSDLSFKEQKRARNSDRLNYYINRILEKYGANRSELDKGFERPNRFIEILEEGRMKNN